MVQLYISLPVFPSMKAFSKDSMAAFVARIVYKPTPTVTILTNLLSELKLNTRLILHDSSQAVLPKDNQSCGVV